MLTDFAISVALAVSVAATQAQSPAWWLARAAQGETGRLFPAEARAEEWVMWTARNRVEDSRWPGDYQAVVEGGFNGHRLVAQPAEDVVALAQAVLDAPADTDPTGGSLFMFSADDMRMLGLDEAGAVRRFFVDVGGRRWGLLFFVDLPGRE